MTELSVIYNTLFINKSNINIFANTNHIIYGINRYQYLPNFKEENNNYIFPNNKIILIINANTIL